MTGSTSVEEMMRVCTLGGIGVPKFNYIASIPNGESSRGVLDASSKSDLAKKLKEKGLFLVSCRCR